MKLSRIIATAAAFALIGTAGLVGATSASADDFYVTAPLPAEVSPYPAGWFAGTIAAGGSATSTVSGLSLVGPFQILNGTTPGTDLVGLVSSAEFDIVSGDPTFQIPLWGNANGPESNYTTLVPTVPGSAGLYSVAPDAWRTTYPIYAADGTTVVFAADALATLQEFQDALDVTSYEILAFGAIVTAGNSAVISSITWDGDTHWFLPTPTATVSPASLSVTDSATAGKGVTGVFTGFVPGENVTTYLSTESSGGSVGSMLVADANGAVTFTYVASSKLAVGSYNLGAFGETSEVNTSAVFAVVADTLAATGTESTPFIAAGGIFLLLGVGLVVSMTRMRRRAAAQR